MYGNSLSSSNDFVSNHRIFRCENVVKQTMCLITCNALVRVSHRMVSFSELLQHFNFHPKSDLFFHCRRFSLLTRWSFSKPWWDCNLLCWSRTNWRVQVWVPIKVVFSTIFVCGRSALVPWTDITLKKKNKNLQVLNFLIAASVGSLSCMCILFFQENVILGSDYPFPLGEHHPGKLIEDVYKDDLELRVREQSHSVSRFFLFCFVLFCFVFFAIYKTPPSSLLKLPMVVIEKFCYHGNMTSHFSCL